MRHIQNWLVSAFIFFSSFVLNSCKLLPSSLTGGDLKSIEFTDQDTFNQAQIRHFRLAAHYKLRKLACYASNSLLPIRRNAEDFSKTFFQIVENVRAEYTQTAIGGLFNPEFLDIGKPPHSILVYKEGDDVYVTNCNYADQGKLFATFADPDKKTVCTLQDIINSNQKPAMEIVEYVEEKQYLPPPETLCYQFPHAIPSEESPGYCENICPQDRPYANISSGIFITLQKRTQSFIENYCTECPSKAPMWDPDKLSCVVPETQCPEGQVSHYDKYSEKERCVDTCLHGERQNYLSDNPGSCIIDPNEICDYCQLALRTAKSSSPKDLWSLPNYGSCSPNIVESSLQTSLSHLVKKLELANQQCRSWAINYAKEEEARGKYAGGWGDASSRLNHIPCLRIYSNGDILNDSDIMQCFVGYQSERLTQEYLNNINKREDKFRVEWLIKQLNNR
jgi:hypothetical protein